MVIIGRILVFFGLAAILHAGYSAVQCKYTIHLRWAAYKVVMILSEFAIDNFLGHQHLL